MARALRGKSDSLLAFGGTIPGSDAGHAYRLQGPDPSEIPVLIAVPHAGRAYPAALIERMRNPAFAAPRLEDRYADTLAEAVARATGAMLLVADAPRAMIDLNRAPDDVDWEMFARGAVSGAAGNPAGRRARSGLGLIPRRLPGLGELWKRRHEESELAARLAGVHEPYHAALAGQLAALRDRWGTALLIDLHSMPPLPARIGQAGAEFVVGDRFGASCHGRLVAAAFAQFSETGRMAAHNRPYAGGYVLDRHAGPGEGLHAMQIEIDRRSYLDVQLDQPGPGFAPMVDLLCGLVRRLAGEVAALAPLDAATGWAEAAE